MITPLTHGAVAAHPNLTLQKSPGIALKRRGDKTKDETLADPKVLNKMRRLWYVIKRLDESAVLLTGRRMLCKSPNLSTRREQGRANLQVPA